MFEFCSCTVAIGGDIRSVVPKPIVSVPEILLLQHLHGADAVSHIKVIKKEDTTSEQERDRLGRFYGDHKIAALFNQFGELPKTIEEARIQPEFFDAVWKAGLEKPKAAKKAAPRKRARTKAGHFVADNPETPENEAYVEG